MGSRLDGKVAFVTGAARGQGRAHRFPTSSPEEVANLAAGEARYITGQQIRIDGGALIEFPNGPTRI